MAMLIDLRSRPRGGDCVHEAIFYDSQDALLNSDQFAARVAGKHLIIATHGFNVDRSAGIARLRTWEGLYTLPPQSEYVALLWPGDAQLIRVIDYPVEGTVAIAAGKLLAEALNRVATRALSISMISHSLGARVILQAAEGLKCKVRVMVLMASAIEQNCLREEYERAAENIRYISVLASRMDHVLELAYPAGNLLGTIFMSEAPNLQTALGRDGPNPNLLAHQLGDVLEIDPSWSFDHGDYLPDGPGAIPMPPAAAIIAGPALPPGSTTNPGPWKPTWTAAYASHALAQR